MARERFDIDVLDLDDPFELDDGNIPHLAKHPPFTAAVLDEAWRFGEPRFLPAADDGPADWLMVAQVAGSGLILVPLAAGRSARQCRPIGIYPPSKQQETAYWQDQ